MSEEEYDIIVKIVLIGDSGVGKSNLLLRYLKNEFVWDSKATVGVEFGSKKFKIENHNVKAQIWDTAGQERYRSITNAYYKGSKGALVVYDISRKVTFENVDKWISDLRKNSDPDVMIILVGNKCDLQEEREVTTREGQDKAKINSKTCFTLDVAFLETSARNGDNVETGFSLMIGGK
jgi:small GTP-binding protein